ncbi:MAG: hypothetical protein V4606_01230 [Patescibacteria group bacterium]
MNKKIILFFFLTITVLLILIVVTIMQKRSTTPVTQLDSENDYVAFETVIDDNSNEFNQDLKNNFTEFLSATKTENTWSAFAGNEGNISIETFATVLNGKINSNISSLIDVNDWKLYKCATASQNSNVVMSLRFKLQFNYQGDLYADQMKYLKEWEKSLVADVAPIIFPKESSKGTIIQQADFTTMTDIDYITVRRANVLFSDGSQGFMHYIFVGDELLFSGDVNCLLEAQELLFDTKS